MDFHGITMKGDYFVELVASVPSWSTADEKRIIYAADEDRLYYGVGSSLSAVTDGWVRPLLANANDEPDADNTYTLGSGSKRWDAIYAVDFEGIARQARYA